MRLFITLLLILAAAAGVVLFVDQSGFRLDLDNDAVTSPVVRPRRIFAAGIVEGARRELQIGFEVPGRIVSIDVSEGDRVSQGQVLARLDDALWQAQLAEAESEVELAHAQRERIVNGERPETRRAARSEVQVAKSQLEQAQLQLDRGLALEARRAIPQQELDDLKTAYSIAKSKVDSAAARAEEVEAEAREDELRIADARVAAAQAKVLQAKETVAKAALVAPSDGLILQVRVEPGALVTQTLEPFITMADVSTMRTRAYVEELDAFQVEPGMTAKIVADGKPDEQFDGTVVFCAPYMTPKRVFTNAPGERTDVKVREVLIEMNSAGPLVVGLPVDVYFDEP